MRRWRLNKDKQAKEEKKKEQAEAAARAKLAEEEQGRLREEQRQHAIRRANQRARVSPKVSTTSAGGSSPAGDVDPLEATQVLAHELETKKQLAARRAAVRSQVAQEQLDKLSRSRDQDSLLANVSKKEVAPWRGSGAMTDSAVVTLAGTFAQQPVPATAVKPRLDRSRRRSAPRTAPSRRSRSAQGEREQGDGTTMQQLRALQHEVESLRGTSPARAVDVRVVENGDCSAAQTPAPLSASGQSSKSRIPLRRGSELLESPERNSVPGRSSFKGKSTGAGSGGNARTRAQSQPRPRRPAAAGKEGAVAAVKAGGDVHHASKMGRQPDFSSPSQHRRPQRPVRTSQVGSQDESEQLGMRVRAKRTLTHVGLEVTALREESPADIAGIRTKDLVTHSFNQALQKPEDLAKLDLRFRTVLRLRVVRCGETLEMDLRPLRRPHLPAEVFASPSVVPAGASPSEPSHAETDGERTEWMRLPHSTKPGSRRSSSVQCGSAGRDAKPRRSSSCSPARPEWVGVNDVCRSGSAHGEGRTVPRAKPGQESKTLSFEKAGNEAQSKSAMDEDTPARKLQVRRQQRELWQAEQDKRDKRQRARRARVSERAAERERAKQEEEDTRKEAAMKAEEQRLAHRQEQVHKRRMQLREQRQRRRQQQQEDGGASPAQSPFSTKTKRGSEPSPQPTVQRSMAREPSQKRPVSAGSTSTRDASTPNSPKSPETPGYMRNLRNNIRAQQRPRAASISEDSDANLLRHNPKKPVPQPRPSSATPAVAAEAEPIDVTEAAAASDIDSLDGELDVSELFGYGELTAEPTVHTTEPAVARSSLSAISNSAPITKPSESATRAVGASSLDALFDDWEEEDRVAADIRRDRIGRRIGELRVSAAASEPAVASVVATADEGPEQPKDEDRADKDGERDFASSGASALSRQHDAAPKGGGDEIARDDDHEEPPVSEALAAAVQNWRAHIKALNESQGSPALQEASSMNNGAPQLRVRASLVPSPHKNRAK